MRALVAAVRQEPNIRVLEQHLAIDLLTDEALNPSAQVVSCWGAYVLERETGKVLTITSRATQLATGGAGKVYLYTSNPDIATGDGMAMAYRAGAILEDMEFVQFHPTALYLPNSPPFLLSEAIRGEGGRLRNIKGELFMHRYHPDGARAPRDIVSRAIWSEMAV